MTVADSQPLDQELASNTLVLVREQLKAILCCYNGLRRIVFRQISVHDDDEGLDLNVLLSCILQNMLDSEKFGG